MLAACGGAETSSEPAADSSTAADSVAEESAPVEEAVPAEEEAAEEMAEDEHTEEPAEEEAEATEEPAEEAPMDEPSDIVDTAVAAGSFTTLAAALDAAGRRRRLRLRDQAFDPPPARLARLRADPGRPADGPSREPRRSRRRCRDGGRYQERESAGTRSAAGRRPCGSAPSRKARVPSACCRGTKGPG